MKKLFFIVSFVFTIMIAPTTFSANHINEVQELSAVDNMNQFIADITEKYNIHIEYLGNGTEDIDLDEIKAEILTIAIENEKTNLAYEFAKQHANLYPFHLIQNRSLSLYTAMTTKTRTQSAVSSKPINITCTYKEGKSGAGWRIVDYVSSTARATTSGDNYEPFVWVETEKWDSGRTLFVKHNGSYTTKNGIIYVGNITAWATF